MSNPSTCMQLDRSADSDDYWEALEDRLLKAHAVTIALLGNDHWKCLSKDTVTNALWTVETLIEETQAMGKVIRERQNSG